MLTPVAQPEEGTPPLITPHVTGTLGERLVRLNVAVSWSVSDPELGVPLATGCDPTTSTADTAGVTFTCTATSAGGTTSESGDDQA